MKHIIVGNGNLGTEIGISLSNQRGLSDDDITYINSRSGFDPDRDIPILGRQNVECVWIAAGGMSIEGVKMDFAKGYQTFVDMPSKWIKLLPHHIKLVLFTSDYAYEPTLSKYAELKATMDSLVHEYNRPNTCLVQVSSLYGRIYPERCFPGRIILAAMNQPEITLPINKVTPTPCDFVAENLVKRLPNIFDSKQTMRLNMAPKGSISTFGWGQLVLQDHRKISARGYDPERPQSSHLDNYACPYTWVQLWTQRANWFDEMIRKLPDLKQT